MFFVDEIDLKTRRTKHFWRADNHEATVEDLAHQVQSLLDLQDRQLRSVTKEDGLWTRVVRHNTKGPIERGKLRRAISVQNDGTRPQLTRTAVPHSGPGPK